MSGIYLTQTARDTIADILRREGDLRMARIEFHDPEDLRAAIVESSNDCWRLADMVLQGGGPA